MSPVDSFPILVPGHWSCLMTDATLFARDSGEGQPAVGASFLLPPSSFLGYSVLHLHLRRIVDAAPFCAHEVEAIYGAVEEEVDCGPDPQLHPRPARRTVGPGVEHDVVDQPEGRVD